MDRAQIDNTYDDPVILSVDLYRRDRDGVIDTGAKVSVGSAEQRAIDSEDEPLFSKIAAEVERCVWTLCVPTFSTSNESFSPMSVNVETGWLLKESSGKEWLIVRPVRKSVGMSWRCPAVECLGEYQVKP
ncbi:MAG: hypothetical protein AAGJ40_09435 [Planctomycetota bacterium]